MFVHANDTSTESPIVNHVKFQLIENFIMIINEEDVHAISIVSLCLKQSYRGFSIFEQT